MTSAAENNVVVLHVPLDPQKAMSICSPKLYDQRGLTAAGVIMPLCSGNEPEADRLRTAQREQIEAAIDADPRKVAVAALATLSDSQLAHVHHICCKQKAG
jgi:hypothetical protein